MENNIIDNKSSLIVFANRQYKFYFDKWLITKKLLKLFECIIYYIFLIFFLLINLYCDVETSLKYFIIYLIFCILNNDKFHDIININYHRKNKYNNCLT